MLDTTLLDLPLKSAAGLITLDAIKGFGGKAIAKVTAQYEFMGEILQASPADLKSCLNVKQVADILDPATLDKAYRVALKEMERAAEIKVALLSVHDERYPAGLREIEDPPLVLYAGGNLEALKTPGVACVGTRDPTYFGNVVANGVAKAMAESGLSVVSGLAKGIDAVCHRAAIAAKGVTCAVLGSAVDVYSSSPAFDLAQDIINSGGLILSEQRFGTDSDPNTLTRRNRIQTGLSQATIVMQAGMKSGTMHTIRYSILQGKPLYVPDIPEKYRSETENHLAINIARMSASDFGRLAEWPQKVMDAVLDFDGRPAADGIMGSQDYPRVVAEVAACSPSAAQTQSPSMGMGR